MTRTSESIEAGAPAAITPADRFLTRAAEVALAAAIFVPPFLFGARQAYGQLALAVLVLVAGGLTVARSFFAKNLGVSFKKPEILLPLAMLLLSVVTWIALPTSFVQAVSPGMERVLPGWTGRTLGELSRDGWPYLSLAPGLSREGTFLCLLYVVLFWVTLATVRSLDAVRRLLGLFLILGVAVAVVGLLHYLFWNGTFYGFYKVWWMHPDRHVRAPFTNRNHFAGFLALTIGPGLAWLAWLLRRKQAVAQGRDTSRRPSDLTILATGLGLVLVLAGVLLSQSRGGAVVAFLALAVALLGLFRTGFPGGKAVAAIALIAFAGLGIVLTFGGGESLQRVNGMVASEQTLGELANGRLELWRADLHALVDFPLFGSGVGSHPYVYPLYLGHTPALIYSHAENCYIQVLMECGLAGGTLLVVALGCVGFWCWRSVRRGQRTAGDPLLVAALAVAVSLLAAVLHAFVDFTWYVPAYAAALAVLVGLACALCRLREAGPERGQPQRASMTALARLSCGTLLTGAWLVLTVLVVGYFVDAARAQYAWDRYYALLPADDAEDAGTQALATQRERLSWLKEACRYRGADPDHFLRLGTLTQREFVARAARQQEGFNLVELRHAVQDGRFATPEEARDWLKQVHGKDLTLLEQSQENLRQSLRCCPLVGMGYVRLAELHFLETPIEPDPRPFLQQALLVRPTDPQVALQAGIESWRVGDVAAAGQCWQRVCRLHAGYQARLLPVLAAKLPAETVVALLQPDFDGLKWLAQQESAAGRPAGQRQLVALARKRIEEDSGRSKECNAWLSLAELYLQGDQPEEAETCLRKAVSLSPMEPRCHIRLIRLLMERGKRNEAVEQTRRARELFPDHAEVRSLQNDMLGKRPAENRKP